MRGLAIDSRYKIRENLMPYPVPGYGATVAGLPTGWDSNWAGGGTAAVTYSTAGGVLTSAWTEGGAVGSEVFAGTYSYHVPVVGGSAVAVSVEVKITGSTAAALSQTAIRPRIYPWDSSGALIGSGYEYMGGAALSLSALADTWTTIGAVIDLPANAVAMSSIPYAAGPADWIQPGVSILTRNMLIVAADTLPAYFDGDSPSSRWTGTPGASTSLALIGPDGRPVGT